MAMNSRIAVLEQSIAAGNKTMDQLGVYTGDVLTRLAVIEGMLKVVDDLKQHLRDFTKTLLPHIFGREVEGDVESQD
ncbi:hypothetical protein J3459_010274 [Metarhizium acridum]|nr:hypothetical protein J3459_010274 [Metarhizium acridum]